MIADELIDQIAPYIKQDPTKKNWLEMGLVDDAPLSAQIAFEHYVKIQENAKKYGLEI